MTRLFVMIPLALTLTAALVACEGAHDHPHEAPAAPDATTDDKEHGGHEHGDPGAGAAHGVPARAGAGRASAQARAHADQHLGEAPGCEAHP